MSANMRGVRQAGSPGDHRCTPPEVWQVALRAVASSQFDLDPASNAHSSVPALMQCRGVEHPYDNGLIRSWAGAYTNIWLNPPFSRIMPWVDKVSMERNYVGTIQMLVPGDTSTEWWQRLAGLCHAWAAAPKRYHFPLPDGKRGSPPAGVHIFLLSPEGRREEYRLVERWRDTFIEAGWPVFPRRLRRSTDG